MKVKLVRIYEFNKIEFDECVKLEAAVGATNWEEIEEKQFFTLRQSVQSANYENKDYKVVILTGHDISAPVLIKDFIEAQEEVKRLRELKEQEEKKEKAIKKELAAAKKQQKALQKQIEDEENARKLYEQLKNKFE